MTKYLLMLSPNPKICSGSGKYYVEIFRFFFCKLHGCFDGESIINPSLQKHLNSLNINSSSIFNKNWTFTSNKFFYRSFNFLCPCLFPIICCFFVCLTLHLATLLARVLPHPAFTFFVA